MLIWHFLSSHRMILGRKHPAVAWQWISLGDLFMQNSSPGQACAYFERGLKILEDACDENDKRLYEARGKVADCRKLFGQFDEAERLRRKMLGESVLLGDFSSLSDTRLAERVESDLWKLVEILVAKKSQLEASKILSFIVAICEREGLPLNERAIAAYQALSNIQEALGLPAESRMNLKTAKDLEMLGIMKASLGKESMGLVTILHELKASYAVRGKLLIVRQLDDWTQICVLSNRVKGVDYPGVVRDLEMLASLYETRNESADRTMAFHLRARVKRISERSTLSR
jgi:tetratricopeptide (TPR) repeat protein